QGDRRHGALRGGQAEPDDVPLGAQPHRCALREHRDDRRPDGHGRRRGHRGRTPHDPGPDRDQRPGRDRPLPVPSGRDPVRRAGPAHLGTGRDRTLTRDRAATPPGRSARPPHGRAMPHRTRPTERSTTMGVLPLYDYERIRSAIREAARSAWLELRAARPNEAFYYFGFVTTPNSHRP